jgi:hypothetical protein
MTIKRSIAVLLVGAAGLSPNAIPWDRSHTQVQAPLSDVLQSKSGYCSIAGGGLSPHNHNHNQYTLMYDKERLLQCCWFGTNTSLWYHSVAGGGLLKKQD